MSVPMQHVHPWKVHVLAPPLALKALGLLMPRDQQREALDHQTKALASHAQDRIAEPPHAKHQLAVGCFRKSSVLSCIDAVRPASGMASGILGLYYCVKIASSSSTLPQGFSSSRQ